MANRRLAYGMEMYKERAYPDWMLGCFDHFGYDQTDETDGERFVDDLTTYQKLLAVNTYEAGYRGPRVSRSIEESELELAELPRCEWKVPAAKKLRRARRVARLQRRGSLDSWWLQPTEQRRRLQETFKRACFEAITRPSLEAERGGDEDETTTIPDSPPSSKREKTDDDDSKTFWDRYYAAQRANETTVQEGREKYWQSPDLFAPDEGEEGEAETWQGIPIIRFDDLTVLRRLPKEREKRGKAPDLVCLETMNGASSQDTIILSPSPTPPAYSPISSAQQSPTEVRLSRARSTVALWERRLKASELAIEAGKANVDRMTRLESTAESYRQSLKDAKDQLELLEASNDCYVDGEDSFTFGRMTDLLSFD